MVRQFKESACGIGCIISGSSTQIKIKGLERGEIVYSPEYTYMIIDLEGNAYKGNISEFITNDNGTTLIVIDNKRVPIKQVLFIASLG